MKAGDHAGSAQHSSLTHGLWERTASGLPLPGSLEGDLSTDVVVIGAGYTGLSTALCLSESRVPVVVLEAADIGFGGSGRNVGLVNAGMWVMPDTVVARLGPEHGERLLRLLSEAPALVFNIISKYSIECEAVRRGTLHCGVGRRGLAELRQRAAQWRARSAPVELLDATETGKRTGSSTFSGALFDPRAGTIQPLAYARGLAAAALNEGAKIFVRSPATAVVADEGGWRVRTPSGSVRAHWVVIATDAYATGPWDIVRREQVHLPYFNFALPPLDRAVRESILPGGEGAWDTRAVLSSFRLDSAGRLIFGSVGSLRGSGAAVHRQWALRAVRRIFPQLGRLEFESGWFGHIGMTADNLPRFHVFAPHVVGVNGYNGRGIGPGTTFGRVLAGFVLGQLREQDLPLPVSEPRSAALRSVREAIYASAAQMLHFAGARF
ncbi:MAG TPA: FAD-binding oxidoreductase [Steroidobacteraceae bacterium]|nr:FAD-binding oxidoreductase [Steroidobacteraceae bacterium]